MPSWDSTVTLARAHARTLQSGLWPLPLNPTVSPWVLGQGGWLMGQWLCKRCLISTYTAVISVFLAWACSLLRMEGIACVNKMTKRNQRAGRKQPWNCYIHQELHTMKYTIWYWQNGGPQEQKEEIGAQRRSEKNWTLLRSWHFRVGEKLKKQKKKKPWVEERSKAEPWKHTDEGGTQELRGQQYDSSHEKLQTDLERLRERWQYLGGGGVLFKPSHMANSLLWYIYNLYARQSFGWLEWVRAEGCSPGGRGTWYWCRGSWKAWRSRSPFHALQWWSDLRLPGQLSERRAESHHTNTTSKTYSKWLWRITSYLWHNHLKRRWGWQKKRSIRFQNLSNAFLYPSASLPSNSTICGKDNPVLAVFVSVCVSVCMCWGTRELTKRALSRQITWQSKGW